jgi:hypothetical protein
VPNHTPICEHKMRRTCNIDHPSDHYSTHHQENESFF